MNIEDELTSEYTFDAVVTAENVISSFTTAPFTLIVPLAGTAVNPEGAETVNEYVPLVSATEIDTEDEDRV